LHTLDQYYQDMLSGLRLFHRWRKDFGALNNQFHLCAFRDTARLPRDKDASLIDGLQSMDHSSLPHLSVSGSGWIPSLTLPKN
jgi:hypothetical protein